MNLFLAGIVPTLSGKGRRNSYKLDESQSAVNNEVKDVDKLVEVVVSNRDPSEREVTQDQAVKSQSPPTHSVNKPADPKVKVGTILVATERLGDSPPFAKSKILILKAGRESGFMGVIFNKRLRWTSFPDLDGGETAELLKDTILSLGGPVMDPEKPLLALSREGDPPRILNSHQEYISLIMSRWPLESKS